MKKILSFYLVFLMAFSTPVQANDFPLTPQQKQAAITHLSEALKYKTVTHYDLSKVNFKEFLNFHSFLEKSYPLVHQNLQKTLINKYSLVYKWPGKKAALEPVLFTAHYDVVPAETKTLGQWSHPPFSGKVADGKVWGRGSMDDKSSLTAIMESVELLLSKGYQPERTIYLAFGHDEEISGLNGAGQITSYFKTKKIRFKFVLDEGGYVITDEFLGIKIPIAFISTAEKGSMNVRLSVKGAGGHSSRAPHITGIDTMAEAIHKIDKTPMPSRMDKPLTDGLEVLAPHMPPLESFVIGNRWLFEGLLKGRFEGNEVTNASIRTLITPTMINGGTKENALPKFVTANLNIRLLPGDTIEDVLLHLRKTINDERVKIEIKGTPSEASQVTDVNSRSFQYLKQNILKTYPGILVAPVLSIGATDTVHYGQVAKNTLRFLPIKIKQKDGERIHGINERISVDNYYQVIRFYFNMIRNLEDLN